MEKSSPSSLLPNPYYFCECTGDKEVSWKEVATAIGEGLHKAGKIQDPTPRTLPEDLYGDVFANCKSFDHPRPQCLVKPRKALLTKPNLRMSSHGSGHRLEQSESSGPAAGVGLGAEGERLEAELF